LDTIKQYTKGVKMRVDQASQPFPMVWDGSRWIGLIPESKQFMIIPNMGGIAQIGGVPVGGKNGQAVSLGKSSVVAGIKCELWHVKALGADGKLQDADVCLAKDAGFMVGRMTVNDGGRQYYAAGLAYDQARASGMGVLSVTIRGKMAFQETTMRAAPEPDSLFVVPHGYTATTPHGP
jgi:hypothetical protein